MRITMLPRYGIGCSCWSVFASISRVPPRMLAQELTKHAARTFVERVNRLLNWQEENRAPDAYLKMAQENGVGHGRWCLVWDAPQRNGQSFFARGLTKQAARTTRNELNIIIEAIRELRFDAMVVDRLREQLAANTLLLSKGTSAAVQGLVAVNGELKKQINRLESGRAVETRLAA